MANWTSQCPELDLGMAFTNFEMFEILLLTGGVSWTQWCED